jgi:hypothetical protein
MKRLIMKIQTLLAIKKKKKPKKNLKKLIIMIT